MRREIHNAIRATIEFGLTIKWTNEFLPAEFVLPQSIVKKKSQSQEKKKLRPLKLQHVTVSFMFYAISIITTFLVYVCEMRNYIWIC